MMQRGSNNWRIVVDLRIEYKLTGDAQQAILNIGRKWGNLTRVKNMWAKHIKPEHKRIKQRDKRRRLYSLSHLMPLPEPPKGGDAG